METVIYADVLFFINFVIDGMCIAATAALQKKRLVLWRFLCAAAIGGLYAVAAITLEGISSFFSLLMHALAAYCITLVAIKPSGVAGSALNTLCYFFVNTVLGGVLLAVYNLFGRFAMWNGVFYADISAAGLIVGGSAVMTAFFIWAVRTKRDVHAKCCDLMLEFRGRSCTLSCMYDSGNLLVCPYTALPVAVIGKRGAKLLFTEEELKELENAPVIKGVRPLVAQGIGGTVMLPSFVPDKAAIRDFGDRQFNEKQLCVAIRTNDVGFGKTDGVVPVTVI